MAKVDIIVGTVLGASEYVADALQDTLQQAGHQVSIHLEPDLSDISTDNIWLICTSTHGAGELPDNIQPFAAQLADVQLEKTQFLVIGLGDSSYDTFCFGAQEMEKTLLTQGARLLAPALHIDVLNHPIPEDHAVQWLTESMHHLGTQA